MEKFFFVLIPVVVAIAIYSSGYDNGAASKESLIDGYHTENMEMEDKISLMTDCINSLQEENSSLVSIIESTDSALDLATEPGFGYWPSYSDLVDAHSEAKGAISAYSPWHYSTNCDF